MDDTLLTSLLRLDGTSGMSLFEVPSCRNWYKGNSEKWLSWQVQAGGHWWLHCSSLQITCKSWLVIKNPHFPCFLPWGDSHLSLNT